MAREARSLRGKVAVVTGAARGVGEATARQLAREGVIVALADLDRELIDEVAAEIGPSAHAFQLDVSDRKAFARTLEEVEAKLGPLDILINNAGIMPIGPYDEEDPDITDKIIDVNLRGVMHGTKEAIRRMRSRRTGHIINVSSGGGWMASGGGASYCASKFGVVGFSECIALELHGSGVHISVVGPTTIKTELAAGVKEVRGAPQVTPETVAEYILEGLRKPRFAIFVPRTIGLLAFSMGAMPYRLRHMLGRLAGTDKLLLEFDENARAAYEARATGKTGKEKTAA